MKKMILLTTREKILLGGLFLTAVVMALFFFAYKPQIDEIAALKAEKSELAYQVRESVNFADKLNHVTAEAKIINAQLALIEHRRFETIVQEEIILLLNNFFKDADITEKTITFSVITKEEIGESFPGHHRQAMEVSISYAAEYEKSIRFLQLIENYEKAIYIKNVNLIKSDSNTEPVINGLVTLVFIAESPYELKENISEEWDFVNNNYGRENPFTVSASHPASATAAKPVYSDVQYMAPDFFISVKAEASDMPSILIGRSNDEAGTSYVYADSNKAEDVVLNLSRKNGGYYYNYGTSTASFPDGDDMGVFTPTDENIRIRIFSSARISTNDLSGINLNIANSSGKKIQLIISGDDTDRPRVNVSGDIAEIEMIRR